MKKELKSQCELINNLARRHNNESKEKIRLKHLGRKHTPETIKKMKESHSS